MGVTVAIQYACLHVRACVCAGCPQSDLQRDDWTDVSNIMIFTNRHAARLVTTQYHMDIIIAVLCQHADILYSHEHSRILPHRRYTAQWTGLRAARFLLKCESRFFSLGIEIYDFLMILHTV